MPTPTDRKFTKTHEWVKVEQDIATVGISDHAQEELGDITFVELPEVGRALEAGEIFGTIESVKAVSDLYSPVAGEVTEVNGDVTKATETLNQDPYGKGWLLKVRILDSTQLEPLLEAADYDKLVEESSH